MTIRLLLLLVVIGLLMLHGCQFPKQKKWNPLNVLRSVIFSEKQKIKLLSSHPGAKMKMESKSLESNPYRNHGSRKLNILGLSEYEKFCKQYMIWVNKYPGYLDRGDCADL